LSTLHTVRDTTKWRVAQLKTDLLEACLEFKKAEGWSDAPSKEKRGMVSHGNRTITPAMLPLRYPLQLSSTFSPQLNLTHIISLQHISSGKFRTPRHSREAQHIYWEQFRKCNNLVETYKYYRHHAGLIRSGRSQRPDELLELLLGDGQYGLLPFESRSRTGKLTARRASTPS